jgi:hypothetical protein
VRLPETTWSGILLKLWGSQSWLPPAFSRRLEFGLSLDENHFCAFLL